MNPARPSYNLPSEILDLLQDDSPESISELADVWNMVGAQELKSDELQKARLRTELLTAIGPPTVRPSGIRSRSDRPALRLVFARMSSYSAVAACLAILVVASFVFSPDITTVRVPAGTLVSQVTLPDGSTATLAAGSLLSWPTVFDSDVRRVKHHGTGFFDIEPSSIPFEVETFDAVTRVLGTSFSVESWPSNLEAASRVVVATGKVEVRAGESRSILTPGQSVRLSSGTDQLIVDEDVNVALATSWRTGGLAYSNELLGNVLSDLERRYDVSLEAPASIRLRRISIQKQQAPDVSEVIGDISATVGIRYRAIQGGYELYLQ